jgi:hypothetical protein
MMLLTIPLAPPIPLLTAESNKTIASLGFCVSSLSP